VGVDMFVMVTTCQVEKTSCGCCRYVCNVRVIFPVWRYAVVSM